MLSKGSKLAFLLNNIRNYFSRARPGASSEQSMRSTDYESERKALIKEFNQQMAAEKVIHRKYIEQHQSAAEAAQTQLQAKEVDRKLQAYLNDYYSRIQQLNSILKKGLSEIDEQEKTDIVKLYLLNNLPEEKPAEPPRSAGLYIPNGLVLKKLYHGKKGQAGHLGASRQVLLAGVEQEEDHSLFLSKLVDQMNIKNIVTMISPDLPYFIKTERSYLQEWGRFLENPDHARKSKFYLNPKPTTLNDICLQGDHISLVRRGLSRSRTFLEGYCSMRQQNEITGAYDPAPLLTGLFTQGIQRMYFGNYPAYQERRMIADRTPLGQLRELFQMQLQDYRSGNLKFSAQWLFPKEVLARKLSHLVSITRAVVDSTAQRTLLITTAEMAELVGIQWQMGKERLTFNHQDGQYYLLNHQLEGAQQTFVEFIEKLVLLDLMMEPIFTRYFVKYRSFPFLCQHTIGGKENVGKIFAVWTHFYNTYYSLLSEKRLHSPQTERRQSQFLNQFQHPTNLT